LCFHDWTDRTAGCEKEIRHVDLSLEGIVGNFVDILVNELEI